MGSPMAERSATDGSRSSMSLTVGGGGTPSAASLASSASDKSYLALAVLTIT